MMKTIFSLTLIGLLFCANASSVNSNSFNQKSTVDQNSNSDMLTVSLTGNWCDGSLSMVADYTENNGTWKWMKDGTVIQGANSNTLNLVDHGLGTYIVSYHSNSGQTLMADYDFNSTTGPVSNFQWTNHPPIGATRFVGQSIQGDAAIVGWHWDFGDGTFSNEQNPEHFWSSQNMYTVVLTTTDSNGCSNSVTILVEWQY